MKTIPTKNNSYSSTPLRRRIGLAALAFTAALAFALTGFARAEPQSAPIPFSEIGARATADYHGDALAITASPDGARLHCGFQKLEGYATTEGLWLESTTPGAWGKLRLVAEAVGREEAEEGSGYSSAVSPSPQPSPLGRGSSEAGLSKLSGASGSPTDWTRFPLSPSEGEKAGARGSLPGAGIVSVEDKLVRFARLGLTEEYSASVDGVRQDFIIVERPMGAGDLRVELELTGARAESTAYGAKLKLDCSGRALAYSRLRVVDATGQALTAHLDVVSADRLAVRVTDAKATYPIRIDPTFSDANWVSLNPARPGADWDVYALAVDGSGNLYVGGGFTFIGTVPANAIAKWNGSTWSALGSGMPDGVVVCLAMIGTNLYAGGTFTTAGGVTASNIARWNGTAWSALGSGTDDRVYQMAVSGANLYAGGYFTTAGGMTVNYIARWDGSAWSALGTGVNDRVYGVAASGGSVFIGGDFTDAGGVPVNYIAQWNGSAWSALGTGMENSVQVLAVSGNRLYAGGEFTTAGGLTVNHIAQWDGSTWSPLGSGMDWPVYALAVSGTDLYVGGDFSMAGDVPANDIAKWDGSSWSALGSGCNSRVWALAVSGANVYAGGEFQAAGGEVAYYIAGWNGNDWSSFTRGMDWNVYALATSGSDLYVGGEFTTAGTVTVNAVAKWNGTAWSALGSGMTVSDPYSYPAVNALAVSGTILYAGGYFETAGGVTANNIAQWNGSAWSPVALGVNNDVYALAVSGTDLYVGGYFTTASGAGGTLTVNHVAKWSNGGWSALGTGVDRYVNALAVSGSNLYVGGTFVTASGVTVSNIAKWDGNTWSALGSGMNDDVEALALSGSNLYAGGQFTTAGGMPVNYIARWDGSAWSALGSGMNDWVHALAVSGTDLYAGGDFTTAGGSPANYVAKWDGSAWTALGSGVNSATTPTVLALAADSAGHLFVGGYFDIAGANVSPFIAQANLISTPPGSLIQRIRVSGGAVTLDCQGVSGATYALRRATDARFTASLTTVLTTNVPSNGLFRCTDPSPPNAAAFYRLLKQ